MLENVMFRAFVFKDETCRKISAKIEANQFVYFYLVLSKFFELFAAAAC